MARKSGIPAYREHKQSGQAIVTLKSPSGRRRDYLLGKYNSPESRAEYTRLLTEWQQGSQQLPGLGLSADLTVNELMLAFMKHVTAHYVDENGNPTTEQGCYRAALRALKELYGNHPVRLFGPLALKSVRTRMVEEKCKRGDVDHQHKRGTINDNTIRIRMMFRWGVSEELIPSSIYEALRTVAGLQAGRTQAEDNDPVQPVADSIVDETIKHLSRTVSGLVQVQRLTGARPTEVCLMRRSEFDMTDPQTWIYQPSRHKNKWRGRKRTKGRRHQDGEPKQS